MNGIVIVLIIFSFCVFISFVPFIYYSKVCHNSMDSGCSEASSQHPCSGLHLLLAKEQEKPQHNETFRTRPDQPWLPLYVGSQACSRQKLDESRRQVSKAPIVFAASSAPSWRFSCSPGKEKVRSISWQEWSHHQQYFLKVSLGPGFFFFSPNDSFLCWRG